MGSWGTEAIHWRFDGRYTPACITASVEHFLKALDKTFPWASSKADADVPRVLTLAPLTPGAIQSIRALVDKLELDQELREYLADCIFAATSDQSGYARLFEYTPASDQSAEAKESEEDNPSMVDSMTRRLKAEMLLLQLTTRVVTLADLIQGRNQGHDDTEIGSDSDSDVPGETDGGSISDDTEAITPEIGSSMVIGIQPPSPRGKTELGAVNSIPDVEGLVI